MRTIASLAAAVAALALSGCVEYGHLEPSEIGGEATGGNVSVLLGRLRLDYPSLSGMPADEEGFWFTGNVTEAIVYSNVTVRAVAPGECPGIRGETADGRVVFGQGTGTCIRAPGSDTTLGFAQRFVLPREPLWVNVQTVGSGDGWAHVTFVGVQPRTV